MDPPLCPALDDLEPDADTDDEISEQVFPMLLFFVTQPSLGDIISGSCFSDVAIFGGGESISSSSE
jgi:hypothetical protein